MFFGRCLYISSAHSLALVAGTKLNSGHLSFGMTEILCGKSLEPLTSTTFITTPKQKNEATFQGRFRRWLRGTQATTYRIRFFAPSPPDCRLFLYHYYFSINLAQIVNILFTSPPNCRTKSCVFRTSQPGQEPPDQYIAAFSDSHILELMVI